MESLPFLSEYDVQLAFAACLRARRKQARLSRAALAARSSVPAATIKKFELTGQIAFRQLLLLWDNLDDLQRFHALTRVPPQPVRMPQSIEEVLQDEL